MGVVVVLGVLGYGSFKNLPSSKTDNTITYVEKDYGFELTHPLAMSIDTESPELKTNLDAFNPLKVKIGNILLSVLKRQNRPQATCFREGDLKIFTDCLLLNPKYLNKQSYMRQVGDNNVVFQEYEVGDQKIHAKFIDAFVATKDYIYQFETGTTDKNPVPKQDLEKILIGFKITK